MSRSSRSPPLIACRCLAGGACRCLPPLLGTDLGHQEDDAEKADELQRQRHDHRGSESLETPDRIQCDEKPAEEGAGGNGHPEGNPGAAEPLLDLRLGIGGVGRIDVPGFQRPAVEGPEHTLEGEGGKEDSKGFGEEIDADRGHPDQRRCHQHLLATERVSQTPGGQLEEEDDESLPGGRKPDLA